MKKSHLVFVLFLSLIVFTSCTDNSKEVEEINQFEHSARIDKDKIEKPDDRDE